MPCAFCPQEQADPRDKPVFISCSKIQAGERTLFGVSLRFKDDQETEPDSCVYYDAALNVKNCDALQFDRKIRDDGSLVVWHIKQFSRYS